MAASRLLCAAAPKHQYLAVKAVLESGEDQFIATGKSVLEDGWKALDENLKEFLQAEDEADKEASEDRKENSLPELSEGQIFEEAMTKVTQYWTKPPAPYTEDSLLAAMEQAGKKEMEEGVERKGRRLPGPVSLKSWFLPGTLCVRKSRF